SSTSNEPNGWSPASSAWVASSRHCSRCSRSMLLMVMAPPFGPRHSSASVSAADLVLSAGVEIGRIVALAQLLRRFAERAVDHAAAFHRRARVDGLSPAQHVLVGRHIQELSGA